MELLLYFGAIGLNFAIVLWMLLDAVRRDRGWGRWQVLFYFLSVIAIPVWLFRRRRWPVIVDVDGRARLRYSAIAAGIVGVTFTVSPAVGSFVTSHWFQVARVEGQAMAPTLNNQDRLIVNKRVYTVGDPAIGDIVMLLYPKDPEKSFVKRLIASEGDEVQIVNGRVFRNGVRLDEPYVIVEHRSHDNWGPQVVPEASYFVLGDHRNNSSDSREWGYVPREYVLGRITTRWWPISAARRF